MFLETFIKNRDETRRELRHNVERLDDLDEFINRLDDKFFDRNWHQPNIVEFKRKNENR